MSQDNNFKRLAFTDWCIRNRTAIYVFTFFISLAGIYSFLTIPKEQFPDIVVPTISVTTIYPGATPIDVENLITKPLEKQLKSINGVRKVMSNSISDVSIITVEFNTGVAVPVARQKVSDAVDKGKNDLPTDLDEDPQIQELDISEFPIMNINLAGNLPLDRLKKYAEMLEESIEALPEITRVDIVGGLEREIQVNVDLYKMQAAGITFGDLEGAIARKNVNISGGEVVVDGLRRNLRVSGQFKSASELEGITVRSARGNTVFVSDIADVVDGFKEKQDFARLNGKPAVVLNVIKRSGENLIAAADKISEIIEEHKKNKFPEAIEVTVTGDQSRGTREQLAELSNTVVIGFVLVLAVLMFFMGLKSAFFVALAGPLSAVIAFLLMPQLDFTLNIIVLFSFLLAMGIIVDDAIVVIENTHRVLHQYPVDIVTAARRGAGEVFIPVLAGTFTTLGPFVPLLFWPGIVGSFMFYLPVTLIITLGASTLVAFVINPVFAVDFMRKNEHLQLPVLKKALITTAICVAIALGAFASGSRGVGNFFILMAMLVLLYHFVLWRVIRNFQEKLWPRVVVRYTKLVTWLVKGYKPAFVVMLSFVSLIASFMWFASSDPKVDFFPDPDPNFVEVYCEMPMGTDANVTDSVTRIIEQRVNLILGDNNPAVESIITNVGLGAGDPSNPDRVPTPHKSKVSVAFVKFSDRQGVDTREVLSKVRESFKNDPIAAATITVDKEQAGPPTGKPINIEISGDEFPVLTDLERQVRRMIEAAGIQGIESLKSDLRLNKPEIIVEIDARKAEAEGLSFAQIGLDLRTALFGREISKFRDINEDAPIQLRLQDQYRNKVERLMNMDIAFMDMATGRFRQIPLSAVASVQDKPAYSSINRKNQKRVVTLSSNVLDGFQAPKINQLLEERVLAKMQTPEGYDIKLTGEQEDQQETSDFLGIAFLGALALMFAVMVTQFNSVIKPLMIFTTVLFSLIGIFAGFAFTGMSMSIVMTGVGIFALAGIVIRNGILLIEFIDESRKEGQTVLEAAIAAGSTRMTPVVLTAVSTILGLVPLAIGLNIDFVSLFQSLDPKIHFGGDNVAFWGPLAWTIIFGLAVSTFLTLLVVPSMYVMGYQTKVWFRKATAKK
jgi:multidrug efflux pump